MTTTAVVASGFLSSADYRPNQCPYCENLIPEGQKCGAFLTRFVFGDTGPTTLSGACFSNNCERFRILKKAVQLFEGSTLSEAQTYASKVLSPGECKSLVVRSEPRRHYLKATANSEADAVELVKKQIPSGAIDLREIRVTGGGKGTVEVVGDFGFLPEKSYLCLGIPVIGGRPDYNANIVKCEVVTYPKKGFLGFGKRKGTWRVSWSSDFAARTSFLSKGVIAFDPTGSLFGPKMDGFIPQFRKQDWFKAIRNNDAKTVNEMLKEGFDPNTEEDGHGCCPALHIASCEGCVEVAEVLLEHGVNPNNYRDGGDLGGTPLHNLYLGEVPSVRIAKLLIKFGANVNIRNPYGSTPLHLAAEEWNIDLIRVLIENNANVNEPDGNNRTPLESARWKARKNERSLNPEIEKLLAGT